MPPALRTAFLSNTTWALARIMVLRLKRRACRAPPGWRSALRVYPGVHALRGGWGAARGAPPIGSSALHTWLCQWAGLLAFKLEVGGKEAALSSQAFKFNTAAKSIIKSLTVN